MSIKIFLDANILVSVLNKEYPLFPYTSRVVGAADLGNFKVFTSPLCLAIAFYFAEKKSGTSAARKKISLLSDRLEFTSVGRAEVLAVASNKKIQDVEDGLQYYSALNADCKVLVTEDRNDFWFSEIEVLTSRHFLEKYVF